MGTSKSREKWIAGALLFSGRRDPEWELSPEIVRDLQKLWDAMPLSSKAPPTISRLGYRGMFLRGPGSLQWIAYEGIAWQQTATGLEVRTDKRREFEKRLVGSAPEGVLPDNLFGNGQ
jgi:hypothetical protein